MQNIRLIRSAVKPAKRHEQTTNFGPGQMVIFWPRVTFFISKCIYGQKLSDINTFWYHPTTFGYLSYVLKKNLETQKCSRAGGSNLTQIFFSQSWVEKSTKSGPKSDIFEKLTVLGDSKLHFEWFWPKIDPSDPSDRPSGIPQKVGRIRPPLLFFRFFSKNRKKLVKGGREKSEFFCLCKMIFRKSQEISERYLKPFKMITVQRGPGSDSTPLPHG